VIVPGWAGAPPQPLPQQLSQAGAQQSHLLRRARQRSKRLGFLQQGSLQVSQHEPQLPQLDLTQVVSQQVGAQQFCLRP